MDILIKRFREVSRAFLEVLERLPKLRSGKLNATNAQRGVDCHEDKNGDLRVEGKLEFVVGWRRGGTEV